MKPGCVEAVIVAVIGLLHGLGGAALFIGLYAVQIHQHCFYTFESDMTLFQRTGDLCKAPFWVTTLLQSVAGWGVQIGLCTLATLVVDHWSIGMILCSVACAYFVFCLAVAIAYACTDVPLWPFLIATVVSMALSLAETIICWRAVKRSDTYNDMRVAFGGPRRQLVAVDDDSSSPSAAVADSTACAPVSAASYEACAS